MRLRLRNGALGALGGFAAAKIFVRGAMGLRNNFAEDGRFCNESSISQRKAFFARGYFGCKISQASRIPYFWFLLAP